MNIPGALKALIMAGILAMLGWWATTKLGGQFAALKRAV